MLSKVKHDNIVEFIGASMEPALLIVIEFMGGGTLQRYLQNLRPNPLDLKLAIKFALDISHAMEYLHSIGIFHRDLKPANLLLTDDMSKIKIADFGLARAANEEEKTTEVGTYRWMAPEVLFVEARKKGEKKYYNHKVDVYSFSMILWELLTNTTPFMGKPSMFVAYNVMRKVRPSLENIPQELVPLIESCWSHDPASRPEFSEITAFLERYYQCMGFVEIKPQLMIQNEEVRQLSNRENKGNEVKLVKIQNEEVCQLSNRESEGNEGRLVKPVKKQRFNFLRRCFGCSYD